MNTEQIQEPEKIAALGNVTPKPVLYYGTEGDDVFNVDVGSVVHGSKGFDIVKIPGSPDDYRYSVVKTIYGGAFGLLDAHGGGISSIPLRLKGHRETNEFFVFLETGHSFSKGELIGYYRENKPNDVRGTSDADYLFGTEGDDDIRSSDGIDVINGSTGNDRIYGSRKEYDQVNYDGKPSDYIFTNSKLIRGGVKVEKPNGTDNLSGIDGIWFKEDQWYSIEDLLAANGEPNLIFGTSREDYLFGTNGDDVIDLYGGVDVVNGSAGNDVIKGSDFSYDQIDYDGKAADYTFTKNEDGSVTVQKPDGTDTLTDINGIWFKEDQWYSIDDLLSTEAQANIITGSDGDDFIFGTDDNDLINLSAGTDVVNGSAGNDVIKGSDFSYDQIDYDGKAADYAFTKNEDGSVTVQKPNGTDTLTDINGIWFKEDQWYEIEDLFEDMV